MKGYYIIPLLASLLILDEVSKCAGFKFEAASGIGEAKKGKHNWYAQWMQTNQRLGKYDEATRKENKEKIRYLLRDEEGNFVEIQRDDGTVPSTWKDGSEIKLLIHGYTSTPGQEPMDHIRDQNMLEVASAYLEKDSSINTIIMDWYSLALGEYKDIVPNVPHAGQDLVKFLKTMKTAGKIPDLKQVHVIGFGMGAHVAGVAGEVAKKEMEGAVIPRITGLDPSGPEFDKAGGKEFKNESTCLDKADAEFVDIIHCNMGQVQGKYKEDLMSGRFGSSVQAGHADFYVNGGESQPKFCRKQDENFHRRCSQKKCVSYFAESIKTDITACPCEDIKTACECKASDGGQLFGNPCTSDASGKYYVKLPVKKPKAKPDGRSFAGADDE